MKRMVTVWLSVLLVMLPVWAQEVQRVGSFEEIKEKYPDAKLIVMSLEEYGTMKAIYDEADTPYPVVEVPPEQDNNVTVSQDGNNSTAGEIASLQESEEENLSLPNREDEKKPAVEKRVAVSGQVDMKLPNVRGGNGDGAKIILVVIGVVIVAVLVVYAGKFLYDIVTEERNYDYWIDTTLSSIFFSTKGSENYGGMNGVKLAAGFKENAVRIGVAAEVGTFDFQMLAREGDSRTEYDGSYMMAGPHIRLNVEGKKPFFVYLELLGGSGSHKSVDTLALGRAGFNMVFGQVSLGLSTGAIYVGLKETEGIVQNVDNYETISGFEIGYSF